MRRHRQGLDSPSVVDDSFSSRDDVMSETMPPTKRASDSASFSRRLFLGASGALMAAGEMMAGDRANAHLQNIPLNWTAEEQAFATACQKAMGASEVGLATQVAPRIEDAKFGASSDVADVSWNTPVAVFGWPTFPLGVNLHTWAVTACGGTSIGDKGSLAAAAILAAVGFELLSEPELRTKAKEELKRQLEANWWT
jgi:metal-dependent amidase/aminoacylase/carboxypeptidase family protein